MKFLRSIDSLFVCLVVLNNVNTRTVHKKHKAKGIFDETDKDNWNRQAQWTLRSKIYAPLNKDIARNVIYFVGDGMSLATLAATRAYLGQKFGFMGEEIKLSFEAFPYTGLAKTYCVDSNVADSACSGTAYLSGVKVNSGTVGVTASVKRGDCDAQKTGFYSITGLLDWAQKAGKRTGLVTTTRITHATPAAAYAHSAERRWESDTDMPPRAKDCPDIAQQLVNGRVGSQIDVILGGGRMNLYPKNETDDEGNHGYRSDGLNLIRQWVKSKKALGLDAKYVYSRSGLLKLNPRDVSSVLGLFAQDHLPYHLEAKDEDPTLSEMTVKAIQILSGKGRGYVLFIEGGRIDTAHHETKARKALDETAELAKAVEATLKLVNLEDTLVVVTADHSHTMTYNGYSKRGSDILGLASRINTTDNLPYTILSYSNGPGYKPHSNFFRHNVRFDRLESVNYTYPALVPMARETHGGEDVAVYATGPWAHLFTGNFEQNYIPHAIAYAACMGPGLMACEL